MKSHQPHNFPAARSVRPIRPVQLALLLLLLGCFPLRAAEPPAPAAAAASPTALEQQTTNSRPVVEKKAALPVTVPTTVTPQPAAHRTTANTWLIMALVVTLVLSTMLAFRKTLAQGLGLLSSDLQCWLSDLHFWHFLPARAPTVWPKALAEEEAFSSYLVGLRAGPVPSPSPSANATPVAVAAPSPADSKTPVVDEAGAARQAVKEFFTWVPGQISDLRHLLEKAGRAADNTSRRDCLGELCSQIRVLKTRAGLPELLPVWQMAFTLESLLQQLTERLDEFSPSIVRTALGGIELLADLCTPELRVDLATNPPIRVLAVDDDPVSRCALAHSLKRAFDQPDLADGGKAALALVTRERYDVIFLDVRMPGMDGFELCSKIRESALNPSAPVV
ncbi:MAG: hypothetical protein JWR69_484, partial [Pedosphaera sp.]|nr:hypothetical protein [Pedosphaera sp.]